MKNDTTYCFDKVVDRHGTDASKYEEMDQKYGRHDLLPLWIADMDFATCHYITEALRRRLDHPVLGYTVPSAAYWDSIITWLDRRHGWKVSREEITFMPGVKKGLGLCINYFTSRGDAVLIQPPVYHSFRSVIEGSGRRVVTNPLVKDDAGNYMMDIDGLEAVMEQERPALMLVCNPHNPIGLQWDATTLARVAELCDKYNVVLVSDEIYGDMMLGRCRHIPTASVSPTAEKVTVTLGAPTKTFNIEGMVSAWTVVKNRDIRKGFFGWLEASEFNEPPLAAIVATTAAYTQCVPWLDQALEYIRHNVEYCEAFLAHHLPEVTVYRPQASFVVWLDFRALGMEQTELVRLLVEHARVALSDGVSFGQEGRGYMRINVGVPRSVLQEGLRRISDAVAQYRKNGDLLRRPSTAPIRFTKMQGLGNDFVYINCIEGELPHLNALAREISHALGVDGLIAICRARNEGAQAMMRIFNADGSEAQMCGNGIRCVAKYLYDHHIVTDTQMNIDTLSGVKKVTVCPGLDGQAAMVTVDMGAPVTEPSHIPVVYPGHEMKDVEVMLPSGTVGVTAVSMGNPHGVLFVDAFTDNMAATIGPELENHTIWPEKANVEIVRVDDPHTLAVTLWERGVGETMASGTGACAAAVAAVMTGRASWPVDVRLLGGNLHIDSDPDNGHILMTGPAVTVYDDTYYPSC